MKKGLILTLLLAAILAGVMAFSAHLILEQNRAQEEYNRQCQMLEQQTQRIAQKEAELETLTKRYEQGLTEGAAQIQELQANLAAVQAEKDALQGQLDQIAADIESTRQQLENEDSDQSYYLEVYNALTEGLNKVKQYISVG